LNNPLKYIDPTGHTEYWVADEGLNDNGEFWYCVYSDSEYSNLIGIITGGQELEAKFGQAGNNLHLLYDESAFGFSVGTPAYQEAFDRANSSDSLTRDEFYGGVDFGITVDNSNYGPPSGLWGWLSPSAQLATEFFLMASSEFGGGGGGAIDSLLSKASPAGRLRHGEWQYTIRGDASKIMQDLTVGAEPRKAPGYYTLTDGTIVGMHDSSTTGIPTIDISRNGKIYKIRVLP
jgi:hypothetical protein